MRSGKSSPPSAPPSHNVRVFSAPSWLLRLSVHQDYLWFAAFLGWCLVFVLWWWHPRRQEAWAWVPWAAGAAILTALLQFFSFSPPFDFFHDRLVPGTAFNYRPALVSAGFAVDLLTGTVNAAFAAGWAWLALRGRHPAWMFAGAGAILALAHATQPLPTHLLLLCLTVAAACAMSNRDRPGRLARGALAAASLLPLFSPVGVLAAWAGQLPRHHPPQPAGLIAATGLAGIAVLLLSGLGRPFLHHAKPPPPARNVLGLALLMLAWLAGGLGYAHLTGRDNRHELLQNRLRMTAMRATEFPREIIALLARLDLDLQAPGPSNDGHLPVRSDRLSAEAYLALSRQLIHEVNATPYVEKARVLVIHDGWLAAVAHSHPAFQPGGVELLRRATPADLADWQAGRALIETQEIHEIGTPYYCRAPLTGPDGRIVAWLEFGRQEFFQSLERKWRTGPLLVTALGLVLGVSLILQQRAARQRESALRSAEIAAEANRLKSAFLAKVSHELRTPLQSLLGYSELLRRGPAPGPEARAWLDALHQHGELMTRLVNDLVDLAAVEAGTFRLVLRPTALGTVLHQTVESLRPRAEAKGLALTFEIAPDLPAWVHTDPERLRQVALNLIGNAIKYTARGHVIVRLAREPAPDRYGLTVRDSGPGIPPAELGRLFQSFSRLDSSGPAEGLGLGLALSAALCRALDGDIAVASDGRSGSTFHATFQAPVAREPSADPAPAPLPPGGLSGRHLLLIEDNTLVRELFVTALRAAGARCATAATVAEATVLLRDEAIDTVIVDQTLPDGDGFALAATLRDSAGRRRLIGISAQAGAAPAAQQAGLHAFLTKPIALADLIAAIARQPIPTLGQAPALTQLFRQELPVRRQALAQAMAAGNLPAVRATAHYLANSAAVVRDQALLAACLGLVQSAEAGDATAAARYWHTCQVCLAHWDDAPPPPPGPAAS